MEQKIYILFCMQLGERVPFHLFVQECKMQISQRDIRAFSNRFAQSNSSDYNSLGTYKTFKYCIKVNV